MRASRWIRNVRSFERYANPSKHTPALMHQTDSLASDIVTSDTHRTRQVFFSGNGILFGAFLSMSVLGCGGGELPPGSPSPNPSPIDETTPTATPIPATPTPVHSTPTPVPSPTPELETPTQVPVTATPVPTPTETPSPTPGPPTPTAAPPTPTATLEPTPTPSPTPPLACNPPVTITPQALYALPYEGYTFTGKGGSGAYSFELIQNESNAILNERTGAYMAGTFETDVDETGPESFTDKVTVSDKVCIGSATAAITVVRNMIVTPASVELAPNLGFTPDVAYGSGLYSCHLASNPSGGDVTEDCHYTAGSLEGTDRLILTDDGTDEQVELRITVTSGGGPRPSTSMLVLPKGSTFVLNVTGGSQSFDFSSPDSAIQVTGNVIQAQQEGDAEIQILDAYTGQQSQVQVRVISPLDIPDADLPAAGEQTTNQVLLNAGDIDQDGFEDVILGNLEGDFAAYNSGAVYIYAGNATGIDPEPVRVISGAYYSDQLGRSATVADFDKDGWLDLVVGVNLADYTTSDNGVIRLYPGEPGGFFSEEWTQLYYGERSSDQLGTSLASGDFNGDGWMDLAVGAPEDEDNNASPVVTSQGAVYVFAGGPEGFSSKPTASRFGRIPDGSGGWVGNTNMKLGFELATGDVNGDGADDLVACAVNFIRNAKTTTGAAVLYLGGLGASGEDTVAREPSQGWTPLNDLDLSGAFCRHVALGDLDADGLDDIVITHNAHDVKTTSTLTDAGGVRIFRGSLTWPTVVTALVDADAADLTLEGNSASDQFGFNIALGDLTGDGLLDLAVGAIADEVNTTNTNLGTVVIYPGLAGSLPSSTPLKTIPGLLKDDLFGISLTTYPDVDGDEQQELLVWASRDDSLGLDLGRTYIVPSSTGIASQGLQMPTSPAGQFVGWAAHFIGDVNNDGHSDLAVGGYTTDFGTVSGNLTTSFINAGVVWVYLGSETGYSNLPDLKLAGFSGHSTTDLFGYWISPIGDFNGDGIDDFAVVARNEDRPSSFSSTTYANTAECPGTLSDSGAVYIFLGKNGALPSTTPSFVFYGPQASQSLYAVAGGFDLNGDGKSDFATSSLSWDRTDKSDTGGVAFVTGRAATDGKITVICQPALFYLAGEASAAMGSAIAPVGDLDNDGCDEVAVGGATEDLNRANSNQGSLRIFYGWNSSGCRSSAAMSVFAVGDTEARAGYSLSSGHDADGDGRMDLAVGGYNLPISFNNVGAAWLLFGKNLATVTPEPIVDGSTTFTINSFGVGTGALRVTGVAHGDQFGKSVALVPGLSDDGRAGLGVGAPLSSLSGTSLSGGTSLYRVVLGNNGQASLDTAAPLYFGGETSPAEPRLGEWLASDPAGTSPQLLVGAIRSDGLGLDIGAAYVVELN